MEDAYAAVAPNSSARRALVRSPTLPAKRLVNVAIRPNLQFGDCTLYRTTIAPINKRAANSVLNHAMKVPIARSDEYAIPPTERWTCSKSVSNHATTTPLRVLSKYSPGKDNLDDPARK